ncbi:MAG: hypothetical protein QM594_11750 [Niabella sp.]
MRSTSMSFGECITVIRKRNGKSYKIEIPLGKEYIVSYRAI